MLEGTETSYFFILGATQGTHVLPTIVSRCFVQHCAGSDNNESLLLTLFSKKELPPLADFNNLLDIYKQKAEFEIRSDLSGLFCFWVQQYLGCQENNEK
jgi:hypothetical protein